MVFLKELLKRVDLEKNQQTTQSMQNYPVGKELKGNTHQITKLMCIKTQDLFTANLIEICQELKKLYEICSCHFLLMEAAIFKS